MSYHQEIRETLADAKRIVELLETHDYEYENVITKAHRALHGARRQLEELPERLGYHAARKGSAVAATTKKKRRTKKQIAADQAAAAAAKAAAEAAAEAEDADRVQTSA